MKRRKTCYLLLLVAFASFTGSSRGEPRTIFQIGTQDHAFTEFSRERITKAVVYRAGESFPAVDWRAYQPGSLDYQVSPSTREHSWVENRPGLAAVPSAGSIPIPFEVRFSLLTPPEGKFTLHLDAIFRYGRPAAPRYQVNINGHIGSYQLSPVPAPDLWWQTGGGGLQFTGYESLDMVMPASYFHAGANVLTIRCQDGFGIYYDDLFLSNDPGFTPAAVVAASVHPTIFYKRRAGELVELATIQLQTSRPLGKVVLRAEVGSRKLVAEATQTDFGDLQATIEVPPAEKGAQLSVYLEGAQTPLYQGPFVPARRWHVYAMPAEQADFGYDEVPARTLEWENRYTDRALEIQKQFPSYAFNLDAAANLESYLAGRNDELKEELLGYLRNGKFGMNAMYAGFFTGNASTEELFQTLSYSLRAGAHYKFTVDSAAQTDEPTVAWALPQVLAAAGIKYFAEGSDPIRGPFNPIGHMNFHSPFYWESPNGSRVLVWSAVGYVNIEDMAWGGWNQEAVDWKQYSPSLFGLEHTLPLFLSQYDRKDYPFDAVFLYGLHNDEVPIWHNASADVIQKWSEEYAYPEVTPGTQHDFFSYVTKNFDSDIKTYRGDEGAYWEDEAGADAKTAALNRTSQMQVTAAEKLDTIAQWLKPGLSFDEAPYLDAWKNIMLADDYVWSDQDSSKRPFSARTKYEEDTHRGYADAGYRESRDLLRVGMDRVAELIKAENPGVAVFNSESWVRGGFFDVELSEDSALEDPSDGSFLPCGILKVQALYNEVRCWAPAIAPLGYKVFTIVTNPKKAIQAGKVEAATTAVEGKFYRLQLNAQTGAVEHLVDKETGQELVKGATTYGINEYLYVTGGDPVGKFTADGIAEDNRLLASDPTLPVAKLTIHKPRLVGPPEIRRFPWGAFITVHTRSVNTPVMTSTILLNDEEKTVTFDNNLDKETTLRKEGIYFAFPFNVEKPRVEYQGATAWINPETDMLPGANCEWFATQGGVRVSGTNQSVGWVSIDAPLITLDEVNRGLWPTTIHIQEGTVFSYVMNNYWYTDTPAQQGGHFRFRYVLTSGNGSSQAATTQFAIGERAPLNVIPLEHKEWTPTLPEKGQAFVGTSPAGIAVVAMRPIPGGEQGSYLVRVQNGTAQAANAQVQFPTVNIEEANIASVMGEKTEKVQWSPHEVDLPMAPYDVKTLVVRMGPASSQGSARR